MADLRMETKGIIFDIQRYSIHDGPGIRTIVFLKGCPLRCPWCSNPESQKAAPEIEYVRLNCILCRKCADVCPEKALTPSREEIVLDRTKCSMCGECIEVCPGGGMQLVGKSMTVGEVLQVVEKDRIFYDRSEGGITLSGGEPLLQHEFASALLESSHRRGLHTCIETTGSQSWENCRKVIQHTDVVLFDLKIWNPVSHLKTVGVSNEIVLENARKTVELGKEVIVRVAVIPGYNDDLENLHNIAAFARQIGVREIHLLPYHRMGEPKYGRLGRAYLLKEVKPHTREELAQMAAELTFHGVKIQIGG